MATVLGLFRTDAQAGTAMAIPDLYPRRRDEPVEAPPKPPPVPLMEMPVTVKVATREQELELSYAFGLIDARLRRLAWIAGSGVVFGVATLATILVLVAMQNPQFLFLGK